MRTTKAPRCAVAGGVRCALAVLLAVTGCSSEVTPIESCSTAFGIEPICLFQNPEDLVATTDGAHLLVSQSPEADSSNGTLARYSLASGELNRLFPTPDFADRRDWGESDCAPPNPTDFSPHGIDLVERSDGSLALLVINHGGAETVEYFAVEPGAEISWRGCVAGRNDAFWNDLIGLEDGGFMATHMMPKSSRGLSMIKAMFGFDTGAVDHWRPDSGFTRLKGTAMPFPNGIERSADGRYLYVGSYAGGELRKIDLEAEAVVARLELRRPDNLTWTRDGRLLLAGGIDSLSETLTCGGGVPDGGCGAAFEVVLVDPESMRGQLLLAHRGAPMGGVSVALEVGDDLYLGAYAGNRIARWTWRKAE